MSKVASFISLAVVAPQQTRPQPFHRQVYDDLRQAILEGRLKPGARLPSTRALAGELGLARGTVSRAFDQLVDEGYLESRVGSGTRVTQTLPERMLQVSAAAPSPAPSSAAPLQLSEQGKATAASPHAPWHPNTYYWHPGKPKAFNPAVPALDVFPFKLWEKMLLNGWRSLEPASLAYGSPLGYEPLREVLADYMNSARGVRCSPEQVVITGGTQQALSLITQLLLDKGDTVWVENPSFNGIHVTLQAALSRIVPVGIDEDGLRVGEGVEKAPGARLVYISPSHQYPLGVTMSLTRRLELLQWAQKTGAWIVEDDYDSEFRYAGYPLAALQGLDTAGNVIYLGTFSKVLFPALRLGYMVVPTYLIEPLRAARAQADRGLNLLGQVALCEFIKEGHFARHIRRMRALYVKRQAVLLEALVPIQDLLRTEPHDAGLHLVGWLDEGLDDRALSHRLTQRGIDAPALSSFALEPLKEKGLLLGYTAPEDDLKRAAQILRSVIGSA